ncbi:MAG: bifunctional transaldolase/phosoglucose isomerase [Dehalococcoidia bacterium]
MTHPIEKLRDAGQSVWLDYIRRGLIVSGDFERMVRDGWITGVTSNPTIFRKAITGSDDYSDALKAIAGRGPCSPYEAFVEIAGEDLRMAADVLRPVYDRTEGADGFVSFEVQEGSGDQMVDEARRLFAAVGRPNVMIKVPGMLDAASAVEELIANGININITLLFDVAVYEQVASAYIAGLEKRVERHEPVDRVASVASFFVSRVDSKVDAQLVEGSPLRGRVAIANARMAYKRFEEIFAGERWQRLAERGAQVQRPLWASTGTKDPAYSDVLYVEELIAPHTVNTVPENTLRAFLEHGRVSPSIEEGMAEAERILAEATRSGIELDRITEELLVEGLASFGKDFHDLLEEIGNALETPRGPWHTAMLDALSPSVDGRLSQLRDNDVTRRIWARDHTVWRAEPKEIADRLGWLDVVDQMLEETDALRAFAGGLRDEGFTTAVLLGMGGSSLAPEVLHATFGAHDGLDLKVLDTTDPAGIRAVEDAIDLGSTLFIVASKSGTTIETLSHLAYFWERLPQGDHFIAITDPDSPLDALAREHGFRKIYRNPPDIGGRYSALSYFGLVPAALIGVDVPALLDRAHEMLHACHYCVPIDKHPGAWLGAVLGEAALAGRDKLTLVLPDEIATFGTWVEQLIAESTGKEDRGIVPVEGEPLGQPDVYGDDRLFVAIGDHDGLPALEDAGHPVVRLPYRDRLQVGGEFFRWEFATAVAGHVLGIHPFDQPNVQEAKDATARILADGETDLPELGDLGSLLAQVRSGDYIAIHAYTPRTAAIEATLQHARLALRDRYRVATTVGYGPRFLHSTGQLHKGGPNTGVFIQIVGDDSGDLQVPGKPFTFGRLKRAQALGDYRSLEERGRRVARVTLEQLQEVAR